MHSDTIFRPAGLVHDDDDDDDDDMCMSPFGIVFTTIIIPGDIS